MHLVDYLIFGLYMAGVLAIGLYYFFKNKTAEDYYVGSRSIKAWHVGLSIVATDVGGGFSIGLGGVGFLMGLSGSWLLFTGLVGAWMTAVLIIPKIKRLDQKHQFMTFPDFLRHRYNGTVALTAALISGIGYLGFTGAQMLAGAKLASATILQTNPFGMEPVTFALLTIAVITILYTVIGGLKAVIYTDTIQWGILLTGLMFVTIPVALYKIGGFSTLRENLPRDFFSLTNISWVTFFNWMITIVPIWLIGMTLYQRMYACKDEKQARRAWYVAGIFEYPIMAFTGVFLGMCARVVFPEAESEMAMPMLIRDILPVGVTGIVIASYFSAIMSTADSCLMASSGNFVNDVIERYWIKNVSAKTSIRLSMVATFVIGTLSVLLAAQFGTVLNAILYAYAFMVSGLVVPTVGAYFWKRGTSHGALAAMLGGGVVTILLMLKKSLLPEAMQAWGFDVTLYGITTSLVLYVLVSLMFPEKKTAEDLETNGELNQADTMEYIDSALVQHGPMNQRIYLMKIAQADPEKLAQTLDQKAKEYGYSKIFAKVPAAAKRGFLAHDFEVEASVPGFYNGEEDGLFLSRFYCQTRLNEADKTVNDRNLEIAQGKDIISPEQLKSDKNGEYTLRKCEPSDAIEMARVYGTVFDSYPFAIDDPAYLRETMETHVDYFCAVREAKIVALASAEMSPEAGHVEMTDFATLPDQRGSNLALRLLYIMEEAMRKKDFKTAFTIARAASAGMNVTFAKAGYEYAGRLVNNTNIAGRIESMNVWYKPL